MSATSRTVLYGKFWNFAYIFFFTVWECACGLGIIVRTFLLLFPHCELSRFFHPLYYKQLVPFVSATPLTVLYRLLWNFSCVFFMVWGCACDLDVIVRLFFSLFPHCELRHFSPSIYRQWIPREHNSSYNFILIFAHVLSIVWRCARAFHIILAVFFVTFLFSLNIVIYRTRRLIRVSTVCK